MKISDTASEVESPPSCLVCNREIDFTDGESMEIDVYRAALEKVEYDWQRDWRESQTLRFCSRRHAKEYFSQHPFPDAWNVFNPGDGDADFDWGALGWAVGIFAFLATAVTGAVFLLERLWRLLT